MSYFRLALSEDENDNNKGFRDSFLKTAKRNKADMELESDEDEIYSRKQMEYEGGKKKIRQMTFFLGVACILIILIATLLVWQHFITTETPCVSPSCVETAGFIVSKMDFSVDPCDDFYQYSCGGWLQKTNPPPDKPKWSNFAATYKKNYANLKRVLEVSGTGYMGKNSSSVYKAKKYYTDCMNSTDLEERGITPALQLIRKLGSWTITSDPVSGQWVKEDWKPMDTILRVHKYNHGALFGMVMSVDSKNSSTYIIKFGQNGLTLGSREEYMSPEEKYHIAFLDYAERFGLLLGGDNTTRGKMEEVYQFEKKLAQIFVPKEELLDPVKIYHKMTLAEFQEIMGPSISFSEYLKGIFGEEIPDSEKILVETPEYFRKLGPILQQTKPEVLVNYLIWSLLQVIPGYLPNLFGQAALILDSVETGITELSQHWDRCVSKADTSFGFVTGALYVEDPKRFPPKTKPKIEKMLGEIQSMFLETLPAVDWMEESVKEFAIDKAKAVKKKVAYPDWIKDPSKLDKYYENVEITDGFFESMLNLRTFYHEKNIKKRGTPPDESIWSQTPVTVNAYYSISHNFFAFPAGILQRPFYDPDFPVSFNYGAMGFIMGHELTHGFDSTGRHYDKYGNLYDWWGNESLKGFKERAQCLVDQYDNFQIHGKPVKGERTLGENIADNGGLKVAYQAYLKYINTNTEEESKTTQLPGLPPEDAKLFFIGFAQVWCAYYKPAYADSALLTDSHSPAKYRVIGPLSNSEEFSDVFGCRKNVDAMNPGKKCQVW